MEQDELFNISGERLLDFGKTASDLDSGVKSESENIQNSEHSESVSFPSFYCVLCMCDVEDLLKNLNELLVKENEIR